MTPIPSIEARIETALRAAGASPVEIEGALVARRGFIERHGRSALFRREVRAHAVGDPGLARSLELARLAECDALGRSAESLAEAGESASAWLDARGRWIGLARVLLPLALTGVLVALAIWDSPFRRAFYPAAASPDRAPEGPEAALLTQADRLGRALTTAPPLSADAPPGDLAGLVAWAGLAPDAADLLGGFGLDADRLRSSVQRDAGRPRAIVLADRASPPALLVISRGGARLLRDGRAWWR